MTESPSVFRNRAFLFLVASRFLSAAAIVMQNVAIGWQVYAQTGKVSYLGYVGLAQFLPFFAFILWSGQIADRFDRRKWLIAMQTVQLVFSAALAPLVAHDAPIWALFMVQMGVGIGNALNMPAWSAMLPTRRTR